jgi:pimeloyl-ACP methyl ester carboxylesterase
LLRLLTLPGAEYVMPIAFPKPIVDRATDVGRQLGRRNIRSPRLAEMWRAYSSLAGATNRKAFVRTMRGVIEPTGQTVDASDRLYLAAHVPTMIVWGDQDGIIPVEHGYAAHELIPTSRLEILEGVGHFPHVEQADTVANLLIDFVETTDSASTRHEALRDVLLEGA